MINIITSKSPVANSSYIYKKIEDDLKAGEKSFLIVPEQYTLQTDINLMEAIDFTSVMDAKVLSFSSLASFIISRTGGSGMESLTKAGKIMVLTTVLAEINDELTLFKNNYHDIDFVNDIERLISNIKDNNFDEAFFKTIANDVNDEVLKLKFKETKLIYDSYQAHIEGTYLDGEDRLNAVISKLGSTDFVRESKFYFDKFDYISDIKLDFISELVSLGADVTIALTLDKDLLANPLARDIEIYDMANKLYYKLKELGEFKEENLDVSLNENADINHLLENFEKYRPLTFNEAPKNIRVIESTTTPAEVANIALYINELIATKKARYRDIAIYITDEAEYKNEISKIFNRYEIPLFLNETSKLSENHILKTYLAALRLVIYNFNPHDLDYFIRSNLYDFGENAADKILLFQSYIRTRNIKGDMFTADKFFTMDEDFYKNLYIDDPLAAKKFELKKREFTFINEIRDELLKLLGPLIDLRGKRVKTSLLVEKIYELFSRENFHRAINAYQNILLDEENLDSYRENDQVWDKLMDILEELNSLMGERENTLLGVYELIKKVAEDTTIGIIPPTKDHVIVTDFKSPRIAARPINIALGLNDTFFPSKSRREFLIGKEEKEKLKGINLDLKIYEEDLEEKEKLNFYKMAVVSKKLILSYSLSNKAGEAINKSLVLNNILKIFPALKITDLSVLSKEQVKFSKDLSQKKVLDAIWAYKNGKDLSDEDLKYINSFMAIIGENKEADLIKRGLNYNANVKHISRNIAAKLYKKNHYNVTEIETYSKCPYRHFVGFGLKPAYDETYDVDSLELGSIVHNSLEDVSRLLKDYDLDEISSEQLDELITTNFNTSIEKTLDMARRSDPRNEFILKNIYKNTLNNGREVINQLKQGDFRVADVEADFGYGKEGDYPAVFVDDENYLRGRIDRIDRAGDFIRIIDYKTGKKEFKLVNVLNGLDLQLVIYMMSLNDQDNKITPIGSFYMPLADELTKMEGAYDKDAIAEIYKDKFKMNGLIVKINEEVFKLIDKDSTDFKSMEVIDRKNTDVLSIEDQALLDKFAKDLVARYIKEIKNGKINLNPIRYNQTQNECQYCDFKGICKFDESIDSDKYRDFDKTKSLKDLKAGESDE